MAELRKIAIVGSARIPFCRAYTGYADESNLTMDRSEDPILGANAYAG